VANENGRSLAAVVAELKDELKDFLQVRLSMLASEMRDKASAFKAAMPMMVIGGVLLLTSWFLITGAIVAVIYVAFLGNAFAAAIALAVVGAAYLLMGGILLLVAYRGLKDTGLLPHRTLRVLSEDRVWLANEVRTQV
jgi:VIT1/CCC1 family predicted Fe2+/Mn2+ transporter